MAGVALAGITFPADFGAVVAFAGGVFGGLDFPAVGFATGVVLEELAFATGFTVEEAFGGVVFPAAGFLAAAVFVEPVLPVGFAVGLAFAGVDFPAIFVAGVAFGAGFPVGFTAEVAFAGAGLPVTFFPLVVARAASTGLEVAPAVFFGPAGAFAAWARILGAACAAVFPLPLATEAEAGFAARAVFLGLEPALPDGAGFAWTLFPVDLPLTISPA